MLGTYPLRNFKLNLNSKETTDSNISFQNLFFVKCSFKNFCKSLFLFLDILFLIHFLMCILSVIQFFCLNYF